MVHVVFNGKDFQKHLDFLQERISEFHGYILVHNTELSQFKDRITWFINPQKTPRSGCTPDYRILLSLIPTTRDEAHITSHEMEHCRLWHRGFPDIQPDRTGNMMDKLMPPFCSAISNMIYNPIIESHLKHHYPDLCVKDQKGVYDLVSRLNDKPIENHLDYQKQCCYFVTGYLTLKLLCEDTPQFSEWECVHSGNGAVIKECANNVISILERNGYSSPNLLERIQPEQINRLLREIADLFNISCRYSAPVNKIFLSFRDSHQDL